MQLYTHSTHSCRVGAIHNPSPQNMNCLSRHSTKRSMLHRLNFPSRPKQKLQNNLLLVLSLSPAVSPAVSWLDRLCHYPSLWQKLRSCMLQRSMNSRLLLLLASQVISSAFIVNHANCTDCFANSCAQACCCKLLTLASCQVV